MVDLNCKHCGCRFFVHPCRASSARFCSNSCRLSHIRIIPHVSSCARCGENYRPTGIGQSYCGRQCAAKARAEESVSASGKTRCGVCRNWRPPVEMSANGKAKPWLCLMCRREKDFRVSRTVRGRNASLRKASKKRGLAFEISIEQHAQLLTMPCVHCGGPLCPTGGGLDRIDNSVGYTPRNVAPCCGTCNSMRSDRLSFEEMQLLKPILAEIRLARHNQVWRSNEVE